MFNACDIGRGTSVQDFFIGASHVEFHRDYLGITNIGGCYVYQDSGGATQRLMRVSNNSYVFMDQSYIDGIDKNPDGIELSGGAYMLIRDSIITNLDTALNAQNFGYLNQAGNSLVNNDTDTLQNTALSGHNP